MTERTDSQEADSYGTGFFSRLKERLHQRLGVGRLDWLAGRQLDEALAEQLEDQLLLADVGVDATQRIIDGLRRRSTKNTEPGSESLRQLLRNILLEILEPRAHPLLIPTAVRPFLILMVGVNGSGKTTTIGKLAKRFSGQGLSVLLAAGDTYRAAAIEQLQAWGERNATPVISQEPGADPAAVIFDAFEAARARGTDVVLADTAGRLQTQAGLMRELEKIVRVAGRLDETAPHEKMLVLDASLGQNALSQAVEFHEAIGLTGIAMTKLDSGARGGILLAIADRLDVPFRFLGIGEQADDMDVFDAEQYVDALLEPHAALGEGSP
jgi:fused signal recognition particle receptor